MRAEGLVDYIDSASMYALVLHDRAVVALTAWIAEVFTQGNLRSNKTTTVLVAWDGYEQPSEAAQHRTRPQLKRCRVCSDKHERKLHRIRSIDTLGARLLAQCEMLQPAKRRAITPQLLVTG